MNNSKAGSYGKLIAFFLVAVIVLCAFGFAVEGWQTRDNTSGTNSGINTPGNTQGGDNQSSSALPVPVPEPEPPKPPEHTDYITGLEISAEEAGIKHICFTVDSLAPLYGIHGAQMIIEIPIENNDTRYLVFKRESKSIGKIGSIAPTRAYLSTLAKSFSSVLVSLGADDTVNYSATDISGMHFDLTKNTGYSYSEYSKYHYSNGELISAGLTNSGISVLRPTTHVMPYNFTEFFAEATKGNMPAQSVTLPYGDTASTSLSYSQQNSTYILSKNGSTKLDTLTDSALEFTNVFVLFADSVTYEGEGGSEMVMNTTGSGKGVYLTAGTAQNISWISDASGAMTFLDESGKILTVNRGTSYIGFVKSAKMNDVKFS